MRISRRTRAAIGIAVAGIACTVYAGSVIAAFAHPGASRSAFSSAYQYQYFGGLVTGKGAILANKLKFEFDAKSDSNGVRGSCDVQQKPNRVRCLTVTSLVVVG